MTLSIIIVTYNSEGYIENCLRSIYKNVRGLEFEVLVVDNASTDKTVEIIKKEFPKVELTESKENYGFAKAVNMAMRESEGEYVLLLNPDMVMREKSALDSIRYLEAEKEVGILGCQFLNPDYSVQASFGNFPSGLTEFLQATFLYKLVPFGRYVPYSIFSRRWFSEVLEADWVSGGFMMIDREVIDKIGGLDEKFFMYFEDIDYCRRAREEGIGVIYYPEVQVIHHHMGSSEKAYDIAMVSNVKSLFYYFRKYKQSVDKLGRIVAFNLYIQIGRYYLYSLLKPAAKEKMKAYQKALQELKKQTAQ